MCIHAIMYEYACNCTLDLIDEIHGEVYCSLHRSLCVLKLNISYKAFGKEEWILKANLLQVLPDPDSLHVNWIMNHAGY